MQTLIEDLDISPELDPAKVLNIIHNGEELAIHFKYPKLKRMFQVFYERLGKTVEYCEIYSEAGVRITLSKLSTEVADINRAIAGLNLRVVNDEGKGYRLVEGLEHEPIRKSQWRTYVLEDGQEISIKCNEQTFDLLDYIATSNGVTIKDIQSRFGILIEKHAYDFMQALAKYLKPSGWLIKGIKGEGGVRMYRLVNVNNQEEL